MLKRHCHICNIKINDKYYIRHIFSKKHLKNIPDCSRENENRLNKVLSLRKLIRENDKSFQ